MALNQNSSWNQGTQHSEEVHRASVSLSFWQMTLCWLAQNNATARLPTESNQRKYFKRTECAKDGEAFALQLKSGRLLLKSESQWNSVCHSQKGKLSWHACYFPSLLSLIIKKGQFRRNCEPSFPFTTEATMCVRGYQTASCGAAACLQATQRHAVQFKASALFVTSLHVFYWSSSVSEVKVKHAGSVSYYRCILMFSTESLLLPKACLVSRVCGSWWISHWILSWRMGGSCGKMPNKLPLFDVCLLHDSFLCMWASACAQQQKVAGPNQCHNNVVIHLLPFTPTHTLVSHWPAEISPQWVNTSNLHGGVLRKEVKVQVCFFDIERQIEQGHEEKLKIAGPLQRGSVTREARDFAPLHRLPHPAGLLLTCASSTNKDEGSCEQRANSPESAEGSACLKKLWVMKTVKHMEAALSFVPACSGTRSRVRDQHVWSWL